MRYVFIFLTVWSCGKSDGKYERCRSAEEAQIKCQLDYVEKYQSLTIPTWVKDQCVDIYPDPGCYFDSSKRYYW